MSGILVAYYTSNGHARKIALEIAKNIDCDTLQIKYAKNCTMLGKLLGAVVKSAPKIESEEKNPANYRRVVLISPIWGGSLAAPIRTFLRVNKDKIRSLALVTTSGKSKAKGAVKEIESLGLSADAALEIFDGDYNNNEYKNKLKGFYQEAVSRG